MNPLPIDDHTFILSLWLIAVRNQYNAGSTDIVDRAIIDTPFGRSVMKEGSDDEGDYITIGFGLPEDVYAEIEDGTYGVMQGFRIYKEDK